uniref:REF/SRPP-like protein At1g67360 n=1 Tax=Globodera pallida TaxID=36090 RepID=A0A183C629_GLOPA
MARAATPLVQNVGKFTRDVAVPGAVNGAQKGCDAICNSVLPAVKKAAQNYGVPTVNSATPYLKNVAINSGEVVKKAYNVVVRPSAAALGHALQQMPELREASSSRSGSNKRKKGFSLKRLCRLFKKKN